MGFIGRAFVAAMGLAFTLILVGLKTTAAAILLAAAADFLRSAITQLFSMSLRPSWDEVSGNHADTDDHEGVTDDAPAA
jgi:hypothetical protein